MRLEKRLWDLMSHTPSTQSSLFAFHRLVQSAAEDRHASRLPPLFRADSLLHQAGGIGLEGTQQIGIVDADETASVLKLYGRSKIMLAGCLRRLVKAAHGTEEDQDGIESNEKGVREL
jgi:hypothetical protein